MKKKRWKPRLAKKTLTRTQRISEENRMFLPHGKNNQNFLKRPVDILGGDLYFIPQMI